MKKKMKKIITRIGFVVLAVVLLVGVLYYLFGERAIKTAVETGATRALKVDVGLGGVSLNLLQGEVGIFDLAIDNPEGYQHEKLLLLDVATLKAETCSLFRDTVIVNQIRLDGVEVVIEQKGTTNNLQEIIDNLPESEEEAEERKPDGQEEKPSKKLKIDKLIISDVKVKAKLLPIPGKADTVTLKLDPIVIEDIGGDDGISAMMLTQKVMVAIAGGVASQGGSILPEDMVTGVEGLLNETENVLINGLEDANDLGKDVMEGVKGLFNNK